MYNGTTERGGLWRPIAIADSIEEDWVQANALYKVAEQMVEAGETKDASTLLTRTRELADKVTDSGQRNEVQRIINDLFIKIEEKKK